MGVFMITLWYAPHKAPDVAKLFLKKSREIPFVSKWRAFTTAGGEKGVKQYHLIYTERGKSEEAMVELTKYFMPFLAIESFTYISETLMGVSDSMKMLGMEW
jgi:hypothetical protein